MTDGKASSASTESVGLRAVFAPDYREFSPYQQLLAQALVADGVKVDFLKGYRRLMPLYRGLKGMPMDVFHMHYPAHYFLQYNRRDLLRKLRFPIDLALSVKDKPVVFTVHDLYPLDQPEDFFLKRAIAVMIRRANALIVHSAAARDEIEVRFPGMGGKCAVIPHGDLSPVYGEPLPREVAREKLELGGGKICLMLGILTRNKGAEELIEFWKREKPDVTLAIVGKSKASGYADTLTKLAGGDPRILLRFGFQTDEQVRQWFSASDCVVINYGKIFTSGVASLARSYGLPVLLPTRHATVDLGESDSSVLRFRDGKSDFGQKLSEALKILPNFSEAADWRRSIGWDLVAERTKRVYEKLHK